MRRGRSSDAGDFGELEEAAEGLDFDLVFVAPAADDVAVDGAVGVVHDDAAVGVELFAHHGEEAVAAAVGEVTGGAVADDEVELGAEFVAGDFVPVEAAVGADGGVVDGDVAEAVAVDEALEAGLGLGIVFEGVDVVAAAAGGDGEEEGGEAAAAFEDVAVDGGGFGGHVAEVGAAVLAESEEGADPLEVGDHIGGGDAAWVDDAEGGDGFIEGVEGIRASHPEAGGELFQKFSSAMCRIPHVCISAACRFSSFSCMAAS